MPVGAHHEELVGVRGAACLHERGIEGVVVDPGRQEAEALDGIGMFSLLQPSS